MRDTHVNDDQQWYDTADIQQVHDLLTRAGAESIWVKRLVPNNNSKQQIFLGNDPSDLAFLPLGTPWYTDPKSQKKKAGPLLIRIPVPWRWVTPDGEFDAPNANMCFYPQYPEVRFSGFLKGCKEGPSELLSETKRGHEEGRCLFFGTVKDTGEGMGHVVALVVGAPSPAAQYVLNMDTFEKGHVCPVVFQGQRKPGEFSILEEAVFCQIEVVQNGVSIQSEKAAGFSPVERKDPPPLLFGFYPIRAWVRLYDSPSNLIILP